MRTKLSKKISVLVGGTALFACLFAMPNDAKASYSGTGYICQVRMGDTTASGDVYGSYGYVLVYYNSAANCSGSYLGVNYLMSSGASSSYYDNGLYLYNSNQINSIYMTAVQAAIEGTKVYSYASTSKSQQYYIRFYGSN
jgi:hypothetical protein